MSGSVYAFACGCLMGSFITLRAVWWWLRDKAVIPPEMFISTEGQPQRPEPGNDTGDLESSASTPSPSSPPSSSS